MRPKDNPNPDTANVSLLIVGNDSTSMNGLGRALAQPGLEIVTASDPEHAMEAARRRLPQIVLATPQPGSLDVAERIVEMNPTIQVVRMTGYYSTDSDNQNHFSAPELRERVREVASQVRRLHPAPVDSGPTPDPDFEGIVARSPIMWEIFSRIRRIAPHYHSVLITGETGTGKDLAAHALHRLSPVSRGRYVVLNCSAVVETLFESELFGHVKGAFTGASCDRAGLFEHAHGGTLFLDEIGDMPLATQAKLLRVLQNQEVQRVGSLDTRKVDVRVVAATNHDLRALIAQKRFREDLYYRLSMVEIRLPQLAERREDLPLLEQHFLKRFAAEYDKELCGLTDEAHALLSRHSWPGNVRELENVIGHAAMMSAGTMLDVLDLPGYLYTAASPATRTATSSLGISTLHEHERQLLIRALASAGGNQTKAARLLRIGRDALRYKLRKHNLEASEPERALATAV